MNKSSFGRFDLSKVKEKKMVHKLFPQIVICLAVAVISAYRHEDCYDLLKQEGYLPQNLTSVVSLLKSVTNATSTNATDCIDYLFGGNSTFFLADFTTPSPTLSPRQIRALFCENADWNLLLDYSRCHQPCAMCVSTIMNYTNEYFICQEYFNWTKKSSMFKDAPIIIAVYLQRFALQLNAFDYKKCPSFSRYHMYSELVGIVNQQYRYGNFREPDYGLSLFAHNRWNRINDTIEGPYGILPRGVYTYGCFLFKKVIRNVIDHQETRIKNEWPSKHSIITGIYIDPRVEQDLIYNTTFELNSIIMSIAIQGVYPKDYPNNPLPGEIVISFTHLNRSYTNPLCVYWQSIAAGVKGQLPSNGYWSNYGQRVFKTNKSMTVCRSTHAGIFALLMEPITAPEEKPIDPLDALNILLSLLSVIILLLYIFVMFLLRCVRNTYSRIYISIAFSCMLSQMFYIGSWFWKDDWDRCTSLSTCIEFFHVAIMSWFMIEAVHQLSRLQYFFNESTNVEAFYNLLGWGFPLAVTIALLEFPYENYKTLRYCWAYTNSHQVWYFGGPLLVLLLVTISLKIITYFEIRKAPEKVAKDINYERAHRSILSSVAILPTFTIFWLIGTFAVRTEMVSFQDVSMLALPILHACVGIEIFYFYFYRNDEVVDAIQYELRLREKEKLKSYEYMRGLNMRVAYKAFDDGIDDNDQQETSDFNNDGKAERKDFGNFE